MVKYPNCPFCGSPQVRTSGVGRFFFWRCWMCGKKFTKDLLFELKEIRKIKQSGRKGK